MSQSPIASAAFPPLRFSLLHKPIQCICSALTSKSRRNIEHLNSTVLYSMVLNYTYIDSVWGFAARLAPENIWAEPSRSRAGRACFDWCTVLELCWAREGSIQSSDPLSAKRTRYSFAFFVFACPVPAVSLPSPYLTSTTLQRIELNSPINLWLCAQLSVLVLSTIYNVLYVHAYSVQYTCMCYVLFQQVNTLFYLHLRVNLN